MPSYKDALAQMSTRADEAEDQWTQSRSGQRLVALLFLGAFGLFCQFGFGFTPVFVVTATFCLVFIAFRQINRADDPLLRALAGALAFFVVQQFFVYGTTMSLGPLEFFFVLIGLCYWTFIAIAPYRYTNRDR